MDIEVREGQGVRRSSVWKRFGECRMGDLESRNWWRGRVSRREIEILFEAGNLFDPTVIQEANCWQRIVEVEPRGLTQLGTGKMATVSDYSLDNEGPPE